MIVGGSEPGKLGMGLQNYPKAIWEACTVRH